MRVLVVTPYSPRGAHDHAAADLAAPFLGHLAEKVDLHVYAADDHEGGVWAAPSGSVLTMHAARQTKRVSRWRHFLPYPSGLRFDWQKQHTRDVVALIERLRPDVVHVEYLQPAELALNATSYVVTATLHDITQRVALKQARLGSGWRALLSWREYFAVRRLEGRLIRRADHIFVFSERDRRFVDSRGGAASVVRIGVELPDISWEPNDYATCLFAGALWRSPNQLSVDFLVREVMPRVWSQVPDVRLRIVGARPPEALVERLTDRRVDLVADVMDLDDEFARASVNLAPSMVPAGVLLKALRSMSVGAPVILNDNSAAPIAGVVHNVNAMVASTGRDFADAIVLLLGQPDRMASVGAAGRELVAQEYSWPNCVGHYVARFEQLALVTRTNGGGG